MRKWRPRGAAVAMLVGPALAVLGGAVAASCASEDTGDGGDDLAATVGDDDDGDDDDDDDGDGDDGGSEPGDGDGSEAPSDDDDGDGGGDDGDGSGGPALDYPCDVAADCQLHSDCCSCVARHREEPEPACDDRSCDRGLCEVWGIEDVICSHACRIALIECDAAMVTCPDDPPACETGFVPSIDERCWSGHCVPDTLCRP